MITTIGSFVLAAGVLLFIFNVLKSLRSGAVADTNPWDAPTLEWSVPSPPPPYNFAVIPTVASRYPLWEGRLGGTGAVSSLDRGMLLESGKETIATSSMDAMPEMIVEMPHDTSAPFVLTIGTALLFIGLLVKTWTLAALGLILLAAAILAWLWPRRELREREARS
jgi:hypothetical protein